MPRQHAKLSPSSASRWLSCPASIRLIEDLERVGVKDVDSVYAREGTAAHALGELKARHQILWELTDDEYAAALAAWAEEYHDILSMFDVDVDEMHGYTQDYVELIVERMALYPMSQLRLEQRMDTGVPTCWGTSDTVIVSPFHVEVIDFKYGSGVRVSALKNPQLRLYGCGALDTYADLLGDTQVVRITVHQPRMEHTDTEELTPDELRAWRDEVIPVAEQALNDPDAPFGPSESACHWCPASGRCKAQAEDVFGVQYETPPDALTPGDMAGILPKVGAIKKWLTAFEAAALDTAYAHDTTIPGYKVVISGGIRKVTDQDKAVAALEAAGFTQDQFMKPPKEEIKGIGELEKLLKKPVFKTLLADPGLVRKSEGRPSLVPDDDDRQSTNPNAEAAKDFGEETA